MSKVKQKEFVYQLESFDKERREGIFKVRNASPANSPWNKMRVEVSKYLAGAITKGQNLGLKPGDTFVGTSFTSTDNDPEFKNNPFKLKHYTPINGSDIPEHFVLELVNERQGDLVERTHITGERYNVFIRRFIKPERYRRYIVAKVSKKLSEIKHPDFRIVLPNVEISM